MIKQLTRWWRKLQMTNYNQSVWTTQNGHMIKLIDMDDNHLRNCIFYLHRRIQQIEETAYENAYALWREDPEVYPFPGMPGDGVMWNDPGSRFPIYYDMLKEADRRRLHWGSAYDGH